MTTKRKQILLVDDESGFLFSASLFLRKAGYLVKVAENGKEGLSKFLEAYACGEPFDLLVTDIRMPGMSGLELIEAVRRSGIATPIFAITSYLGLGQITDLVTKGCDAVIEKPFEPQDLAARVRAVFDSADEIAGLA